MDFPQIDQNFLRGEPNKCQLMIFNQAYITSATISGDGYVDNAFSFVNSQE